MATNRRQWTQALCFATVFFTRVAAGQSFGPELHNTLMPASGGMGGVSIARPQDVTSAINGNPASLTNYQGTEFTFGTGWAEPTLNFNQTGNVFPGITPFSARSHTPGAAPVNIGISQQFQLAGRDATFGIGLASTGGGGVDFRSVPASNGTSSNLLLLNVIAGTGVKLTDKLSAGANFQIGSGFFDGPYVGLGALTPAYGIRGTLGLNYNLTDATTVGTYYQTRQHFNFQDAVSLNLGGGNFDVARDVRLDLPSNVGIGVANRQLLDGRLLLAMDVIYKNWNDADLFRAIYRNQWVLQFGSQYSLDKWRFRAGYVYAESPLKPVALGPVGGVVLPGGLPAIDYLQAQFAVINQNRITAGIGRVDVVPGIDLDFFAGGMFRQSAQLGPFTNVNIESYWAGLGLTWRPCHLKSESRMSK